MRQPEVGESYCTTALLTVLGWRRVPRATENIPVDYCSVTCLQVGVSRIVAINSAVRCPVRTLRRGAVFQPPILVLAFSRMLDLRVSVADPVTLAALSWCASHPSSIREERRKYLRSTPRRKRRWPKQGSRPLPFSDCVIRAGDEMEKWRLIRPTTGVGVQSALVQTCSAYSTRPF